MRAILELTLNDGTALPAVGLGTYKLTGAARAAAMRDLGSPIQWLPCVSADRRDLSAAIRGHWLLLRADGAVHGLGCVRGCLGSLLCRLAGQVDILPDADGHQQLRGATRPRARGDA